MSRERSKLCRIVDLVTGRFDRIARQISLQRGMFSSQCKEEMDKKTEKAQHTAEGGKPMIQPEHLPRKQVSLHLQGY